MAHSNNESQYTGWGKIVMTPGGQIRGFHVFTLVLKLRLNIRFQVMWEDLRMLL